MPPHTAFFWGTVFFLSGVLLRSFFPGSIVILAWSGIFVLLAVVFGYKKIQFRFLLLSVLLVFGGLYYSIYDTASRPEGIPFGAEREVLGRMVLGATQKHKVQRFSDIGSLMERKIASAAMRLNQ